MKTIWKCEVLQTYDLEEMLNNGWFLEKMTPLLLPYPTTQDKIVIVAVLSKEKVE